ncbi:MAG: hypothetical protein H6662_06460 [Ardenticatenaceae bacterium]|nr:hypothetical protein [Anaerolineales bacterium]MCB8921207.1 hypothetical protein [Ardenticatenaceae bacterium]MCB8992172.1 hypothetical protein [Ardenticatenaceae bacterium]MCB9004279.1 hypothetical protein [Ardenticatenaceae bacterium]
MGFPTWTLWGMGVSAVGALLAILLAYLMQSSRFVAQAGLSARQVDRRRRSFTGLALALQLLTVGFFLAGVPIGGQETAVLPTPIPLATNTPETVAAATEPPSPSPTITRAISQTPATGAFSLPPGTVVTPTLAVETETVAATAVPTATPSPNPTTSSTQTPTPSSTPTATPTQTPTPTLTPTPIEGETAKAVTNGGNLVVQRVPGGEIVGLVPNGGLVILQPGHANYAGDLWREVRTVDGILGWVPETSLAFNQNQEN